jgi:hypothetical protein
LKRAAILAGLLMLSGCDGLIRRCNSCVTSPSNQMVAKAEIGKIGLIGAGKLPASADRVYYREECGKDCMHFIRFTAPVTDVRNFAATVLGGRPLRAGYDAMADSPGTFEAPAETWWPAAFPNGFEGQKIEAAGRGGAMIVAPAGATATVWFFEYDL